ncbi:MAG: CoA ester lyase [Thermoleophilia bacterium]
MDIPRRVRPRRSCHSVPATMERMVARGRGLAADLVFIDMEDSVPVPQRGEVARAAAASALAGAFAATTVGVRVNAVGSPWFLGDVLALVGRVPRLDVLLVPKVRDTAQVAFICQLLDAVEHDRGLPAGSVGVELLVERADAMLRVGDIAAACPPRVEALVFGPGDFASSIEAPQRTIGELPGAGEPDPQAYALFAMVLAARAHGLQAVDGPYGVLGDAEGLRRAAGRARALGCDGKWSIHPEQIAVLNEAFSASPSELEWAHGVMTALGEGGAAEMDGDMVDQATRRLAEAVLRRAPTA